MQKERRRGRHPQSPPVPRTPHGGRARRYAAATAAARFIRKTQHNPHGLQVTVLVKLLIIGYRLDPMCKLYSLYADLNMLEQGLERGACRGKARQR